MNFIQNILWNSVEGFVEAGTRTAGGYAGDALIKAGDMIENSGRSVGTGIERRASTYGTSLTGQTYQPSAKALPSTALRPIAKRLTSLPANSKATGPTSKTPLGAKKALPSTSAAKKQLGSGIGGAQKAAIGGGGAAAAGAVKTGGRVLPKAVSNPGGGVGGLSRAYGGSGGVGSVSTSALGETQGYKKKKKKTAVKPGQVKPFKAPEVKKREEEARRNTPYPGTNTLPGQAGRSPVRPRKYKPLERLGAQVEKGKVQHIAV